MDTNMTKEKFTLTDENIENQTATMDICINVANNMIAANDPNFRRIHHVNHHIVLYIKDYILKDKCHSYLEIGTHFGHSLSTMLHSKYPSNFLSLDLFNVGSSIARDCNVKSVEEVANQNANLFNKNNYDFLIKRANSQSSKTRDFVKQFFANGVDLLFIDGDHHYSPVMRDFELYSPLVNVGGFIIFDDYLPYNRECPQAVDKIVRNNDSLEIIGVVSDIVDSCGYKPSTKAIFKGKNSTFIVRKIK